MKKVVTRLMLIISLMYTSVASANVILTLDTAAEDALLGDVVSVDLTIAGLGDGVPLSLSSFDIYIGFDNSALSFAGYNLFDGLGDLTFFEADDFSFGDIGGGLINLAEVSYLSNFELWDFQPPSFTIAELLFTVETAPSMSDITIADALLFDTNGDFINIIGANNTSIAAVPTPASSILMGLGLLALFARAVSRKKFTGNK